jgi:hypothetical protein
MANAATRAVFTVAVVQEQYGVGEVTVLEWIRSGELKAINVARSLRKKRPTWRVTAIALAEFELLHSAGAQPKGRRRRKASTGDVIEFYR